MPTFDITDPAGIKYRVTAPEGATEQDALARVQAQNSGAVAKPGQTLPAQPEQPFDDIRGREAGVDYSQGAPFSTRYNMFRASKGGEEEAYLRGQYGEGNYRKDQGNNWLVKQGDTWMPVYPSGVMESLKNVGAFAGGVAPTVGGSMAGAAAGTAFGGPVGGVAGAALGAAGGKGLDEAAKYAQGFYNKSTSDLLGEMGSEAALAGVFQGAGPLKRAIEQPIFSATSKALQAWGGITPESRAVTQSLERFGVTPPISSVAPGMKTFEYDRRLRNMLMTDPNAAPRIGAIDERMKEVLQGFGIVGPALDNATLQIQDKTAALSGRDVGEGIARRLKAKETGLLQEEVAQRGEAERLANEAYTAVRDTSRLPTGRLGADVADSFRAAKEVFTDNMNRAYGAIDNMTGGRPIVNTDAVSREATALMDTMDPQAVPPIIARLAHGGQPMTFEEAHNLRTTLREMGRVQDLSPIGQRRGNIMHMAGLVDDAIMATQDQVGQQAAQALRAVDRDYAAGVVRFTNKAVNDIIQDVRFGRMPNPETVANLLVDKTSTDATRQMWSMLPEEVQQRVRVADLKNMVDAASVTGRDGRQTLDPNALLKLLNSKEDVNSFIYPPNYIAHLRELATDFQALGGKVDVTNLPPNQVRQALERAIGARRALDEEARTNPRIALRSDNPELVDAGARYFMSPGNEARTLAGAKMLGVNSPEWQAVQRYAITDLLKNAIVPKGLGRTVSGAEIETSLGRLTPAQQTALFGDRLSDIKLIARQARALFPELEDEFGGSLAAASIKGGLPKRSAIRAYAWSWFAGKIADSPQLAKMLAGQIQQSPMKARGTISWLLQSGADMALNTKAEPLNVPPEPDVSQFMGTLGVTPKASPPPEKPTGYQGPQ